MEREDVRALAILRQLKPRNAVRLHGTAYGYGVRVPLARAWACGAPLSAPPRSGVCGNWL